MSSSPILKDKNAIVFGAGSSIGAAVAKEFAAEGAEVFLAGRTKSNVSGLMMIVKNEARKTVLSIPFLAACA